MTRAEFLALKNHSRIKYVGTRPLEELFATIHRQYSSGWSNRPEKCSALGGKASCQSQCEHPTVPKTFMAKGVIVDRVIEDTWSSNADKGKITLHYYSGHCLRNIIPEEWLLVDARTWVEGEAKFKQTKSYIPRVAKKFKEETKSFLNAYKNSIESKLDDLPLDKKMKLIVDLSPTDKVWFTILNTPSDEVIKRLEKSFTDENKDSTDDEESSVTPE